MPTAHNLLLPIVVAAGWICECSALAQSGSKTASVAIDQDQTSFTVSNGILRARISKRSGDLVSLQYKELEVLTDKSGHAGAYWSHDSTGGKDTIARITIDPATNGGERGEISVKGISGGIKMGLGPGAAAGGDFPADIEIRYTLERGESVIYTSSSMSRSSSSRKREDCACLSATGDCVRPLSSDYPPLPPSPTPFLAAIRNSCTKLLTCSVQLYKFGPISHHHTLREGTLWPGDEHRGRRWSAISSSLPPAAPAVFTDAVCPAPVAV